MEETSTKTPADGTALFAGEAWFDLIEAGIREWVRGFIEELIGQELDAALGRERYKRDTETPKGYRNGTRERQLIYAEPCDASQPVTTRELATRIMRTKDMPTDDDRHRELIQKTVLNSLNRAKETIGRSETSGVVSWQLS